MTTLTRITLPILLLAVWQLSVSAGWLSTRILPAPSAVVEAGVALVRSGELWTHLSISGWRAGPGPGLHHRPVEMGRTPARQLGADDPQRTAPGTDSTGHPVVRH